MSGIDLLNKVYDAQIGLSIILLAATVSAAELNRHPWLQIDATLPKPFAPAALLLTVRNVLRSNGGAHVPADSAPSWPALDQSGF